MNSYRFAVNRWALPTPPEYERFVYRHVLEADSDRGSTPRRFVRWNSRRGWRCVITVNFVGMRGEALISLCVWSDDRAIWPLSLNYSIDLINLQDPAGEWCSAFERALALGEDSAIPLLPDGSLDVEGMLAGDPDRRTELANHMYRLGPHPPPELRNLVKDRSIATRVAAAIGLVRAMGPESRDLIESLLDDPSVAVRITARRLLAGEVIRYPHKARE